MNAKSASHMRARLSMTRRKSINVASQPDGGPDTATISVPLG